MNDLFVDRNEEITAQRDAFAQRIIDSVSAVFDMVTIYLGDRLGFYQALERGKWMTPAALAAQARTDEHYTRVWLEQQAAAGILEAEDEAQDEAGDGWARRYRLPPGHQEVLAIRDSLHYLAPLAQVAVGAVSPIHDMVKVYRSGGGLGFGAYGVDMCEGQARLNRNFLLYELGQKYLPQIEEIHARLQSNPPARIADISCGVGWSTIGLAQAYPNVRIDGFDLDARAIEEAWAAAHHHGLTDRVTFHARDGADPVLNGRYDLVASFECIHDLNNPVGVLRTMRRLAGEHGVVLVMDERIGEGIAAKKGDAARENTAERDKDVVKNSELGWMMNGWSVLYSLPVGIAELQGSAANGEMPSDKLQQYALEAGFQRVEPLPIENFFFRFYRLHT